MIVTSTDLPRAASLLSFQPESGTWEERAEYARRAGDALAAGHEIEAAADLLSVLADDSNWRVRHEVAQQMLWVPEDRLFTLSGRLTGDANAYVKRAAERTMDRRRRMSKEEAQQRKETERIAKQIKKLETQLGDSTTKQVVRVLRQHGEQILSQVAHDEQGYYLRDWITVVEGDDAEVPAEVTAKPTCAHNLNERQKWVLTELEHGTKVNRAMLEERFGVADKTAKRDLASLSRRGLITYIRDGRGGFYRLASSLKGVL